MFGVGDYVTRKSYNNDIVFKVIDIRDNIYYLKGVNFRLYADSPKEDLVVCEDNLDSDKFSPSIDDYRDLDRNEYFYLPGKILHIDGDEEYLEKSYENETTCELVNDLEKIDKQRKQLDTS